MKHFVKNVSDLVNISAECSRAGLILFAKNAWINFTLKEHLTLTSLKDAIDQIKYDDIRHIRTNTPAALRLLKTAGANGTLGLRDGKIHIAVIITDGKTRLERGQDEADEQTKLAGNELRDSRLYDQIYAVGHGTGEQSENTLSYIATPSSLAFSLVKFNQSLFNGLTTNISKILCDGK